MGISVHFIVIRFSPSAAFITTLLLTPGLIDERAITADTLRRKIVPERTKSGIVLRELTS